MAHVTAGTGDDTHGPIGLIGLDLGGTRVKAGRVVGAQLVDQIVEPTLGLDPETVVAQLASLASRLDPSGADPVGLAAAGVLDAAAGVVRESPNFPAWRDFPLGRALSRASGRAVVLENDANAVILGEARFGVAQGRRSLFGYTVGTGVGGAIIIEGRLYRGERGMAGELGHVTVVPEGRPCGCGNRGCLEQYAGRVGLRETMRNHPLLATRVEADSTEAPRRLLALADGEDGPIKDAAREVFEEVGRYMGQAAAALVHALDMTTIVVAGGIAGAFHHIGPAMERELVARTFRTMSAGVVILKGTLGPSAGMLGAAAVASDVAATG